jgi:hypothetical protein
LEQTHKIRRCPINAARNHEVAADSLQKTGKEVFRENA